MKNAIKSVLAAIVQFAPRSTQTYVKEKIETTYWRMNLSKSNGEFYNGHFEENFTKLFGFEKSHFTSKRMLDIGCGPLGSLEWATEAKSRVGVDPLADQYIDLNGGKQAMTYVKSGAEKLPFEDASFDVVSIFNALDHVEDVDSAVAEANRVLAPGGDLLLIVEINHKPTLTEPHTVSDSVLKGFTDCDIIKQDIFAVNETHNLYGSIGDAEKPDNPDDPAILCAHLRKRTTGPEAVQASA